MTTILVVDDLATDRSLVSGLLEQNVDWTVHLAANGVEALDQLMDDTPDVVITDMMIPGMNGLELVKQAKAAFPFIPVILMTQQVSEEFAVQMLHRGAAGYVRKCDLACDLVKTIDYVLIAA